MVKSKFGAIVGCTLDGNGCTTTTTSNPNIVLNNVFWNKDITKYQAVGEGDPTINGSVEGLKESDMKSPCILGTKTKICDMGDAFSYSLFSTPKLFKCVETEDSCEVTGMTPAGDPIYKLSTELLEGQDF